MARGGEVAGPDEIRVLRRVRESRNWRLEDVVEAAIRLSSDGRAFDVRQLSEWERGVHNPIPRNRDLLARIFDMSSEVLLAPAKARSSAAPSSTRLPDIAPMSLLYSYGDLMSAMCKVVREAREYLLLTGSRTRDENYLDEVERALTRTPELVHHRVLYGPPHRQVLKDHLVRLLKLRDPHDGEVSDQTLHIGIVDPARSPERFLVVSEREAIVIIPSLNSSRAFDSGLVCGSDVAARLLRHGHDAYANSTKIETLAAVQALPVAQRTPTETAHDHA